MGFVEEGIAVELDIDDAPWVFLFTDKSAIYVSPPLTSVQGCIDVMYLIIYILLINKDD